MLTILQPGFQSTIQAKRRTGFRHFGIASAGALDSLSMAAANLLVGNPREAACIEIVAGTFSANTTEPICLSIVGHGYDVTTSETHSTEENTSQETAKIFNNCNWRVSLKTNHRITIKSNRSSGVCYLSTPGGFDADAFLGSHSTDQYLFRGGFDGRTLKAGDTIKTDTNTSLVSKSLVEPLGLRPIKNDFFIRAIAGPDSDLIQHTVKDNFWRSSWRLSAKRSRMGIRLDNADESIDPKINLEHSVLPQSLESHAVIPGTVQLPESKTPIVLTNDCQTTGGYAKIAVVIAADLWKLAQTPQEVPIQFVEVDEEVARHALAKQERHLDSIENAVDLAATRAVFR